MNRPLRISLVALPWLLLAGMTFLAWLAWVHFQWKDRTLWERMLGDIEATPGQIEALQRGESTPLLEALRARRAHDCRLIRDEVHLAPEVLRERAREALRHCPPAAPEA